MRSKKPKSNPPSKASRPSPIIVSSPVAHPQPSKKLPPWDRTADLVYRVPNPPPASADEDDKRLACFLASHGRPPAASPWTRLPPALRQRICLELLELHHASLPATPVTLSRRCFTRATWSRHDLVPLRAVTRPLEAYLATSLALYADVMLALLSRYTFHVVLSPFVGPRLSPLATLWLNSHGPLMRSLVVEIDMSCLGLGADAAATRLLPGLGRIEALLDDLVASQLRRDESLPLHHLVLLCRRFHGSRTACTTTTTDAEALPRTSYASSRSHQSQQSLKTASSANTKTWSTHSFEAPSTPCTQLHDAALAGEYCPDIHLCICDRLSPLGSRIASLRLCGFSEPYALRLVLALFPAAHASACRFIAPSTAWPLLAGQTCCVDSPSNECRRAAQ
ncbi:hypothetical protein CDD81_2469 [Ophiocordyceps australis]|uniref:F-box domain-containing protein n=1 Tax=Ophiocordyceps australis TaxID=1399860 RepID=A0A2C5Y7A2_9HYPO|nr:hypothetical protein CDD81_2469 [Ophiocordyceps australis]